MLPQQLIELSQTLKKIPGIGQKSSQKLAIDLLQLSTEDYSELISNLDSTRNNVKFCQVCGFFAQDQVCAICSSKIRDQSQICLVEKPTDPLSLEKSDIYRGVYHIINKLISPLDNVFPEHTNVDSLIGRLENLVTQKNVELVLFLKPSFAADTTVAYIQDKLNNSGIMDKIKITRLATGLPLYYNTDTIDQATMIRAFEDRR
jgi:recombination protein RecR